MRPVVSLLKLGRLPYGRALDIQQILFENLKRLVTSNQDVVDGKSFKLQQSQMMSVFGANSKDSTTTPSQSSSPRMGYCPIEIRNSLILVEHEPVYTIGIRSKQYNHNYVSKLEQELADHKLKADFVKTNRGGLITFHGPGQLVAYPIIYLGDFKETIKNRSVRAYVNLLEATTIDALAKVGLNGAHTVKGQPGVWLDGGERKIAFIGISCKRFVTMHGISINCDCDLSWFDHIVSCGIEDKIITSIRQELLLSNNGVGLKNYDKDCAQKRPKLNSGSHKQEPESSTTIFKEENTSFIVGDHLIDVTSNIEHISQAFCLSFSQHFDCKLTQ